MFRIDSQGAVVAPPATEVVGSVVGYFSEGDPSNAIPATIVSADWLNTVQEELLGLLTAAGITPDKADRTQVLDAIIALIEDRPGVPDIIIANNQVVATNLTGLVFDKTKIKSAVIEYDLYRKDAAPTELSAVGKVVAIYKPAVDAWTLLGPNEMGDECGVTFSITPAGQLQYTSSNLTGGSYVGLMKAKVSRFKI